MLLLMSLSPFRTGANNIFDTVDLCVVLSSVNVCEYRLF